MTRPILGVIPARIGSSRLPRKPLYPIAGRPLLEWVWRRTRDTGLFQVLVVATDSPEVAEVAGRFGAEVELTDPGHASGTDRVAEVAQLRRYRGFEAIVNVQGDEPFVTRTELASAARLVTAGGWEVGTVASPFGSEGQWRDPNAVKVVRDVRGGALLFTRAPVPHPREGPAQGGWRTALRHVGIYAYRREALLRWVALPEGALERIERLEQLRPLAAGVRIGVAAVSTTEPGVDTPADAERAARLLEETFRARSSPTHERA